MSVDILVIAEAAPSSGALTASSLELLGAAQRVLQAAGGGTVAAAIAGAGVAALAPELAAHGAQQVLIADDPSLGTYLGEAYVPILEQAIGHADPAVVLLAHSAGGRELAPRLAFRLGCGLVTDCTALRVEGSAPSLAGRLALTKPVYGGSAVAEYAPDADATCVMATLRPRSFEPPARSDGASPEIVQLDVSAAPSHARVVEVVREAAEGPRLKDAKVVVSGGRGLGGPENWHLVEELAAALGGAVGATRAVTDAGWVPPTHQVGLTGTTVTPDLYVAAGISGAVQHIAGMSGSRTIVAVNRDPEANIFKHARFGVVGDVKQVLPALTARVKELRGSA